MEKNIPNENVTEKQLKKIVKKANRTEEQQEIKKFIIILAIVILIVVGVYFLTKDVVKKKEAQKEENKTEVTFDYSKIILGELLNRPYDEYYVIVYNSKDPKVNTYSNFVSTYKTKENSLKVYIADLNDSMNEKFYNKEESNPKAKSINELKLSDLTLIKVKNKQINKYIENEDNIKSELGI
ncbi:MAG: hypothetical protein E7158_05815 [Firmicutes bacterium]|nr:hypothetical protein [Bacillota bacterium]